MRNGHREDLIAVGLEDVARLYQALDSLALAFLDEYDVLGATVALETTLHIAVHLLNPHVDIERGLREGLGDVALE